MIDETLLADPTRCPDCATALTAARDVCPRCALRLTGRSRVGSGRCRSRRPSAGHPHRAARRAATADWRCAGPGRRDRGPDPGARAEGRRAGTRPGLAPSGRPRRIQNLLLALGVGLLGVAAVIFVAVSGGASASAAGRPSWPASRRSPPPVRPDPPARPPVHGRVALVAHRRLALLDCYGARTPTSPPRARSTAPPYWAGATPLSPPAPACSPCCCRLRPAALRGRAGPAARLPLLAGHSSRTCPTAGAGRDAGADRPGGGRARAGARLAAPARAADDATCRGSGRRRVADLAAVAAAGAAAYGEDGSLVVGTALLLVLAAVPALADGPAPPARAGRRRAGRRVRRRRRGAARGRGLGALVDRVRGRVGRRRDVCPCRSCCCSRRCCSSRRPARPGRGRPAAGRSGAAVAALGAVGRGGRRDARSAVTGAGRGWRIPARARRAVTRPPGPTSWLSSRRCGAAARRPGAAHGAAAAAALRVAALPVLAAAVWLVARRRPPAFPVQRRHAPGAGGRAARGRRPARRAGLGVARVDRARGAGRRGGPGRRLVSRRRPRPC